ncbi:MAG: hypothetical protein NTW61_06290, partial [Candidatus Melainabacteria bacterium]|nr:hypothetical protein [Candidatus Melainabacteria bacterium]
WGEGVAIDKLSLIGTGMITVNKQSTFNNSAVFYVRKRTILDNPPLFADVIERRPTYFSVDFQLSLVNFNLKSS